MKWEDGPALWKAVEAIDDPDEQLDFWAAHTPFWGDPGEAYVRWLREGDPERWHRAATHWNWDYGMTPLRWIVTRSDCEAATALAIFYVGEPQYVERIDQQEAKLLDLIRCRWAAGTFKLGHIAYDYDGRYEPGKDLEGVPLSMRCSLPGRISHQTLYKAERFADGFPISLLPPL